MIWRDASDPRLVWGPVFLLVALVLLTGWIYACTPTQRRPAPSEVLGALWFGVSGAAWPIVPLLGLALVTDFL